MPGDVVEAMFQEDFWVPGRVIDTRARQVLVEYDKEATEHTIEQLSGPRHSCHENETPRDVSRKTGVPIPVLMALNAQRYPDLASTSRLRARTMLALPELHICIVLCYMSELF